MGMLMLMRSFRLPLQRESSTDQMIRAFSFALDQEFPGDQKDAEEAYGQHGKSHHHGKEVGYYVWILGPVSLQSLFGHQPAVLFGSLLHQLIFGKPSGKDYCIDRKLGRTEVGIEEVDRKDKARDQERYVRMDDRCNVKNPSGKEDGE